MNQNRKVIAWASMGFVLLTIFALMQLPSIATAQGTSTATAAATATFTATSAPNVTPFPMQLSPLSNGGARCGAYNETPLQTGDCFQVQNGGTMHFYDSTGVNSITLNGANGAITTTGVVSIPGAKILNAAAVKTFYECNISAAVVGTAVVTPITTNATPVVVVASLGAALTGDGANSSTTLSGNSITLRVMNSALTPAANTTPMAVNYCIYGTTP
jgi:hypothetical protein